MKNPSEIEIIHEEKPDWPNLFVCWMQKAPARQLVNLRGIPAVVKGAASYHQLYDHFTVKHLNKAGMVVWLPLQSLTIRGNGHMIMIEKNNLDIAKAIDNWARKNVK